MNNERILAHNLSKKLNVAELEGVSAAGTSVRTNKATSNTNGGYDVEVDVTLDS